MATFTQLKSLNDILTFEINNNDHDLKTGFCKCLKKNPNIKSTSLCNTRK